MTAVTRRLCGDCWQGRHPDEYKPDVVTWGTCARCGDDGLTYRSTIADEEPIS